MLKVKGSCLRPFTADEVETALETLHARFARAYDSDEDGSHDEARLMLVAERCVKAVLDMLKLPADAELMRRWTVKGYDLGPVVEDKNREMVASNNGRSKVLDHIAKTHEIWRKVVREFGGAR